MTPSINSMIMGRRIVSGPEFAQAIEDFFVNHDVPIPCDVKNRIDELRGDLKDKSFNLLSLENEITHLIRGEMQVVSENHMSGGTNFGHFSSRVPDEQSTEDNTPDDFSRRELDF